jgi:uncharacterized membrane protein (DUF485 family)
MRKRDSAFLLSHEEHAGTDQPSPGYKNAPVAVTLLGMVHKSSPEPKPAHDDDSPELAARQSRLALSLFALYLLAYGGFMGLAAFGPEIMQRPAVGGVNVAIAYGLGLILGAFVLAVIYMVACGRIARRFREEQR